MSYAGRAPVIVVIHGIPMGFDTQAQADAYQQEQK